MMCIQIAALVLGLTLGLAAPAKHAQPLSGAVDCGFDAVDVYVCRADV